MATIQHRKTRIRTHDIRVELWRARRRRLLREWAEQDYQHWHARAEYDRRRGILRPLPRRRSA
jgi:hypothetical protein